MLYVKAVRSGRIIGLLQRIYPRPIEAKTERNAKVKRATRGATELNRDFRSDKQGLDTLGSSYLSPEKSVLKEESKIWTQLFVRLCTSQHYNCKKIIHNLNIQ